MTPLHRRRTRCAARRPGAPQRRARAFRFAVLAALLGWLAGCAGIVPAPSATREERAAFDAAAAEVAESAAEDPAAARAALDRFLAEYPDGALAPDARVLLGELALTEGDPDTALVQWRRVARDFPRSRAADVARVRIAEAEWARQDAEAAREVLAKARLSRLDPSDRIRAYRVMADVATEPVARVRWLALLRQETDDEAQLAEVDAAIDTALGGLDGGALERLSRQLGERPPIGRVWLARAERALDEGDLADAKQALERASALPLPPSYGTRLAGAIERLQIRTEGPSDAAQLPAFDAVADRAPPLTEGAAGSIGVVLPLTGPFARFGEESLHGVLLAAGIFGPDPVEPGDASPLRVVVRDSAGDAQRAARAVRELARDPEVVAIVGPLLSAECEAAAAVAEELGVPLLTLSAREEIAHLRSFVFRLRTRPVEEAQLLVDEAMELGARRFAILYRDDTYGRGMRALFWDAAEARGGTIVGVASYDPEATDFAEPIRRLVGYPLISSEEKRLIEKREKMLERARRLPPDEARALRREARSLTTSAGDPLPPVVDFDALFIAESWENVVLIAPQLAFHEVFGARLLGPDGWYDEDLVRVGGDSVEGAVFVAHYFPESETPFVREFADRYDATFEHASNVFAAQAYDAANLVLVQLARGRDDREAVRDGLLNTDAYPGVAGILTMRADGNAQKRPFLLTVERGEIRQID